MRLTSEEESRLTEIRSEIEELNAKIGPLQKQRYVLAQEEEQLNNQKLAARWAMEAEQAQNKIEALEANDNSEPTTPQWVLDARKRDTALPQGPPTRGRSKLFKT